MLCQGITTVNIEWPPSTYAQGIEVISAPAAQAGFFLKEKKNGTGNGLKIDLCT